MSQQNPMHRDGGRRDEGEQPYRDAREAFAENDAEIERDAPLPGEDDAALGDDERQAHQEQAASKRFDEIAKNKDS